MHQYFGFMVLQRSLGKVVMQLNTAGVLAACRVHCACIKHIIWCNRGRKILHLNRKRLFYLLQKWLLCLMQCCNPNACGYKSPFFFKSCYFLLNPWETMMEDVFLKLFSRMLIWDLLSQSLVSWSPESGVQIFAGKAVCVVPLVLRADHRRARWVICKLCKNWYSSWFFFLESWLLSSNPAGLWNVWSPLQEGCEQQVKKWGSIRTEGSIWSLC